MREPQGRVDDAILDQARQQGDPLADAVIATLYDSGQATTVGEVMALLAKSRGPSRLELPDALREYLATSSALPDVERERFAHGEAVFAQHAPLILLVLGFYSLPSSYAARNGVQVLHRTGYLRERPAMRVMDTTQMVVDMLRPGSLRRGGLGVHTAQRVRLIHAAVRHRLCSDVERPWPDAFGIPINQEDMAGTLMTFSFLVLDGLAKLKVTLTEREREDYLYAWVIIGRLLGVRGDLLPANLHQAEALTRRIYQRQIGESAEGKAMTRALIQAMQGPGAGTWLDGVPAALIRHFLHHDPFGGVDVAELLGVPRADWAAQVVRAVIWARGALPALTPESPAARRRLRTVSLLLVDGWLRLKRRGRLVPFEPSHTRAEPNGGGCPRGHQLSARKLPASKPS